MSDKVTQCIFFITQSFLAALTLEAWAFGEALSFGDPFALANALPTALRTRARDGDDLPVVVTSSFVPAVMRFVGMLFAAVVRRFGEALVFAFAVALLFGCGFGLAISNGTATGVLGISLGCSAIGVVLTGGHSPLGLPRSTTASCG